MQDNFNLAKYLRHGNKLLNESVGGYVDLKPINSLNEAPMGDDIMTLELDMAWDFTNPEEDAAAKAAFDQYGIEVKETDGNPGTFEVTGRKKDILAYLTSKFYDMDEEDIAYYYPELLDGELEELERPENIYANDQEQVDDTRMMDLGGDQIEQGIISLLDDGFEPEDILDACKMFINAHVNAAMQGKKF